MPLLPLLGGWRAETTTHQQSSSLHRPPRPRPEKGRRMRPRTWDVEVDLTDGGDDPTADPRPLSVGPMGDFIPDDVIAPEHSFTREIILLGHWHARAVWRKTNGGPKCLCGGPFHRRACLYSTLHGAAASAISPCLPTISGITIPSMDDRPMDGWMDGPFSLLGLIARPADVARA